MLRGHRRIENQLHWVRDMVDEDRSRGRTRGAPQAVATLRNTAISLLRLAGDTDIAAAPCATTAATPPDPWDYCWSWA